MMARITKQLHRMTRLGESDGVLGMVVVPVQSQELVLKKIASALANVSTRCVVWRGFSDERGLPTE